MRPRILFHRSRCSRCGCGWPNPDCYVCREDGDGESESGRDVPDDEDSSYI